MIISFSSTSNNINECIYIKNSKGEKRLSSNESIDDAFCGFQTITIYTKAHAKLRTFSKLLLFLERFVLSFLNIIIMNFPNEWYKNAELFILKPTTIRTESDLKIKNVPSLINPSLMRIQKRQLFINDKEFRTEVEYDEEALNVAFLVYVYDVISLLLYACAAVSFIFICSGKIIIPLIMCIYISILLIIIVLTVIKLAFEKKKKQLIHTLILQM